MSIFYVLVAVVVVLAAWIIGGYNLLVRATNRAKEAWAEEA